MQPSPLSPTLRVLLVVAVVVFIAATSALDLPFVATLGVALCFPILGFLVVALTHGGDPFYYWRKR